MPFFDSPCKPIALARHSIDLLQSPMFLFSGLDLLLKYLVKNKINKHQNTRLEQRLWNLNTNYTIAL